MALAGAVVAISCAAILIRWASAPPLTIAAYRMLLATALLLPPVAVVGRGDLRRIGRQEMLLMLAAGVFLAAHFGLWTVSLTLTSVASSVLFVSAHPLLVAVGERWWLRAPLRGGVAAGAALGLAGSALLALHDLRLGGDALLGDALALGGAVALVGYLLVGRRLRHDLGFVTYSSVVYLVCGLTLVAAALLAGESLAASPHDLPIFLALAVVSTLGGHTVFNWALRHLSATAVALAFLGEPVVAALLAWALLGEPLTVLTLAGGALILVGIYLAVRRPR